MIIRQVFLTILLCVLTSAAVWFYKSQEAKIAQEFPYTMPVKSLDTGLSCQSMITANLYGAKDGSLKGVHGELKKGTDKLAVSVKGERFNFLTRVSVEVGQTESDDGWRIVKNDDKELFAILPSPDDLLGGVSIFMLNKENGTAIWTKTKMQGLGTDTPEAQSLLLKCL